MILLILFGQPSISQSGTSIASTLGVETRRQNDIIAFKWGQQAPIAFHARNLEVAEISDELWQELGSEIKNSELQESLATWNNENNLEVSSGKLAFGIRSLTINVTQICNLKCTYCAAGGDGTYGSPQTKISVEKTLPQLKFFLEQLSAGQSFKITFLGGEPLLYPEGIRAIAQYVKAFTSEKDLKAYFAIVTNGTLINETTLQLLKDIKCHITVSVDGPEYINDKVRPLKNGQGSSAIVTEGLKMLFANKEQLGSISLHGVFHDENMNLIEAYNFYRNFPADKYEFTYGVEAADEKSSKIFAQQMHQIAEYAYENLGEAGLRQIGFFDNIFSSLDDQRRTENFCGAGKSFLVVDAKNGLFTCPWDVGQKNEQVGQGSVLDNAALKKYTDSLIEQNNCQTCWARYLCGGGCMFIHKQGSGSKNTKNKQFCSRMQDLLGTTLLFYKKCREAC